MKSVTSRRGFLGAVAALVIVPKAPIVTLHIDARGALLNLESARFIAGSEKIPIMLSPGECVLTKAHCETLANSLGAR